MQHQAYILRSAFLITMTFYFPAPLPAADSLTAYVGTYEINGETTLKIRQIDDQLTGEIPNRPIFQLKPDGQDRFQIENIAVQFVFLRNQSGRIYAVELRQPLTDLVAKRLGSPAPTLAAVQVPKDLLKRYSGRYITGGLFVIQIRLENDGLIFKPPGKLEFKLTPISQNRFAIAGRPSQIEFTIEADGPASQIILHESGQAKIIRRLKE